MLGIPLLLTFSGGLFPADAATLIAAPLAGKTVGAWMFFLVSTTFRDID